MVIPISTYNLYNAARTNIAIPENKILRLNGYADTGLHPSMTGLQTLYNSTEVKSDPGSGLSSTKFFSF
jgi:hypothetical protein